MNRIFRKQIMSWFVCGFVMPPVIWLLYLWYTKLFNLEQILQIALSPLLGIYVAGFIITITIIMNNQLNKIENYIENKTSTTNTDDLQNIKKRITIIPWLFLLGEVVYCIVGPNMGMIGKEFSAHDYFLGWSFGVPVILLFSMPFFLKMLLSFEQYISQISLKHGGGIFSLKKKLYLPIIFTTVGTSIITLLTAYSMLYRGLQDKNGIQLNDFLLDFSILIIIPACTILLSLIILSKHIVRQLTILSESAKIIAEGDFTQKIEIQERDEIGLVGDSLNFICENLEKLVTDIIITSQNLAQAMEQISSGNQNLSRRTSDQASRLEEIASTVEESSATVTQNANNAAKARELTNSGLVKSEEGNRIALEAVTSINEMHESSKQIAEIISVINNIAFQTNLLALNAAVEAARAGDSGRGFAVVAGEVRNLAQRSGEAAKKIESLIKETVTKVEKGTALVNRTGKALAEITDSAQKSAQIIADIALASQEQRQGTEQINIAIMEMDNMTQQNASLVEETAAASEEMSNQAQDLLKLVQIFKIGDSIRDRVSQEKLQELHLRAADGRNVKK